MLFGKKTKGPDTLKKFVKRRLLSSSNIKTEEISRSLTLELYAILNLFRMDLFRAARECGMPKIPPP